MRRAMPWYQRVIEALGGRVYRIADLAPQYDAGAAAAGRYVFVHNDDVSRMDDVTKWLSRTFDLDTRSAVAVMLGIHHHRYAALGPFDPEEVARLLDRGRWNASWLGLTRLVFTREAPI